MDHRTYTRLTFEDDIYARSAENTITGSSIGDNDSSTSRTNTDINVACTLCGEVTNSSEELQEHLETCQSTDSVSDNSNVMSFDNKDNLLNKSHLKYFVNDAFQCTSCPYRSSRFDYFRSHLAKHSIVRKQVSCPICHISFARKAHMIEHMRTHTGEKPFACNLCPYRATQRGNLNSHIRKKHQDVVQTSNQQTLRWAEPNDSSPS